MDHIEFYNACRGHDWFYDYTEDFSVWTRGKNNRDRIVNDIGDDPVKRAIWYAWRAHKFQHADAPGPVENFLP